MPSAFSSLIVENPKIYSDSIAPQESRLFPYYAGYARSFAETALNTIGAKKDAVILDPWNGSGTTTLAAAKLGYRAIGRDLNPVMVLVAKAGLLPKSEAPSLLPLAKAIVKASKWTNPTLQDPLNVWLSPSSAQIIRGIEAEINRALVCEASYTLLIEERALANLSSLASFFYVSLFRATRQLLVDFVPSNPTWVKAPEAQNRKRPSASTLYAAFLREVELLSARLMAHDSHELLPQVHQGNAERLSLPDDSVDVVITSPPYCTRIDYAVATSIELAVLRASPEDFSQIRRSLMGTSTVPATAIEVDSKWGTICENFLNGIYEHPSKASKTYYFKNHLQYFDSLSKSIGQLARVVKSDGKCILVVQDSYYKDIHNDVPGIAAQMASRSGFDLAVRRDFVSGKSMAGINGKARQYLKKRTTTESVLCFVRS